jgi:hypothetical protein
MMQGASIDAVSKILLIVFSDSPTNLFKTDEAEIAINVHPDYFARALHI